MQVVTGFEVYQAGELTVIGFGRREILDQVNLAECYDEIMELVREHSCHTLAIDLTGVRFIPSGMLGLLASAHRTGIDLHLFNPSTDVREAVIVTNLTQILHMHEIDL